MAVTIPMRSGSEIRWSCQSALLRTRLLVLLKMPRLRSLYQKRKKVERSPEQRKLYEAVEKKKGYVDLSNQKIEDVILLAKALKANTSIKTLKLASNRIQDISALADALKTNTNLIKLDLSYNDIKDVSTLVKVLKTRTSLQWLSLSKNAIQVENQKEIKMVCAEKKIKLEI